MAGVVSLTKVTKRLLVKGGISMIYFTADMHFYHTNIIKHSNRPFGCLEEMHESIIARFNSRVRPKDSLYILGDAVWGSGADANKILKRLNGKKFLIRGNHDRFLNDEEFDQKIFGWVKDLDIIVHQGAKFVLCHYPLLEWQGYFRGSLHCYGHIHNRYFRNEEKFHGAEMLSLLSPRAFNVGVDVNDFSPVSAEELVILGGA